MNTRKKEAAKVAIRQSSAAAAATTTVLDIVGFFVKIPIFIKWGVVALVSFIAGCCGCCMELDEIDKREVKRETEESEKKQAYSELHGLFHKTVDMQEDLAEIKEDLENFYQLNTVLEQKGEHLKKVKTKLDRWVTLARDLKKQKGENVSLQGLGMFTEPLLAGPDGMSMEVSEFKASKKITQ